MRHILMKREAIVVDYKVFITHKISCKALH